MLLKNNIEGIIIKWTYQTEEVLSKDSAAELEGDKNPGPMVEIRFWEAKVGHVRNPMSLYETSA